MKEENNISYTIECDSSEIHIEQENRFNKYRTFANIRNLLKDSEIGIGQIEKAGNCQPGYMSRLEKASSTSNPSVEFLLSAANMLNSSLDVLVSTDISALTPTEKYLVDFIDKLKHDTIADKLEWSKESPEYLNNISGDTNGWSNHPLFHYQEYYGDGEDDYPEFISRITMTSESFGYDTCIAGDCYNVRLANNATLYLMDICRRVLRIGDPEAYSKEIWLHKPGMSPTFLASSKNVRYGELVHILFSTVREYMSHPQLQKDVKSVIDAFMNDNFGVDDESLPFN